MISHGFTEKRGGQGDQDVAGAVDRALCRSKESMTKGGADYRRGCGGLCRKPQSAMSRCWSRHRSLAVLAAAAGSGQGVIRCRMTLRVRRKQFGRINSRKELHGSQHILHAPKVNFVARPAIENSPAHR